MKKQILDYINNHSLTGIKAGSERKNFLDIWMVVVDDRIFARSWGLSEKSWYNTFLSEPEGEIKCGESIYQIKASPVNEDETLSEKINQAYLNKYNIGQNSFYAQGIIKPEHVEKTMEFILI